MDYEINSDYNDFLIDYYLKEYERNIRREVLWNNQPRVCINHTNGTSMLIETEKNHWVFVNIVEEVLNYFDPCGKDIPDDIDFGKNLNLKRILWRDCLINENSSDCLKYSLYVTRQITKVNSRADVEDIINDRKCLERFIEDFRSCKSQFKKIIEKVKVCSSLFSTFIEEMPAITDYKHALHFTYFLESLALQDAELDNIELKNYVINKIGLTNVELIRKIRFWLLHREKCYFIFPQQLHKFTLRENNSRNIFKHFQKFLEDVYQRLCGKQIDISEKNLETFIFHSEEFGNKIDEEEANIILENLSFEFIEGVLSLKRAKNPEKILFNFTVNFIPLLRVLYGNIKPFETLINFRNHLIHNIYILYQSGLEIPYITFQNMLHDVRGFLLKFNLCSKVGGKLKSISETDAKDIIGACLERFKKQFSEEIEPQPSLDSPIDLNYLIKKINLYFQSLYIVDLSNKITVKNIPIEKFELPKFCCRFSEEHRNAIFQKVNVIKEIKLSSELSEDCCKDIEKSIKEDLYSFGLENYEYDSILKSVLDSEYFDDEETAKEILTHISNIMKLKQDPKFDLTTIINDYYMYLENNPNFNFRKYKRKERFVDKTLKIKITIGSFCINLSNLIKNFIPLYFNIVPNYKIFQNLESAFQDREIVELISCNISNMKSFEVQIYNLPFLAPLGVELLCNQKIKLENAEKIKFIKKLTWNLLKYENGNHFLNNLLSIKIKGSDFDFPNECLEMVKQMNLVKQNPNKVLFLFTNPDIQKKLHSTLISKNWNAYSICILKKFLDFLYDSTYELYEMRNYKAALDLVDRKKTGLSSILKEVVEQNLGCSEMRIIKIKFLIAKIKFQMGVQICVKEERYNFLNASFRILNAILTSLLNSSLSKITKFGWELRIKSLVAGILHYLGKCKESCDQYREIFLMLYRVNHPTVAENKVEPFDENGFISFRNVDLMKEIKELLKIEKYILAVKYSNKNINIFQIMMCHTMERFCQIRFLTSEKEKTFLFKEFLEYLNFFFRLKKQILKTNNYPYLNVKVTLKEIQTLLLKYEMDPLLKNILSQTHFKYPVIKRRAKMETLRSKGEKKRKLLR